VDDGAELFAERATDSSGGSFTWIDRDNGATNAVYNRHGLVCGHPCPATNVPPDTSSQGPFADYAYTRGLDNRITQEVRTGGSGLATETT
jgi:hypothetical protein